MAAVDPAMLKEIRQLATWHSPADDLGPRSALQHRFAQIYALANNAIIGATPAPLEVLHSEKLPGGTGTQAGPDPAAKSGSGNQPAK